MCGRFTLTVLEGLPALFEIDEKPAILPRYNIAPTQEVVVVRAKAVGVRHLELMLWGLIPAWADSTQSGTRLINARSETADRKPAFREAFRYRRCLVPADGFFEWKREGRFKQPFYFRVQSGSVFAFAGLWESWRSSDGQSIHSCTILTTGPNRLVEPIHDRMPVILPPEAYRPWLGADSSPSVLKGLLSPFPAERMEAYPVSRKVNSSRSEGVECIRRIVEEDPQRKLF